MDSLNKKSQIDFKEVGHTIHVSGVVLTSYQEHVSYIIMLPDEEYLDEGLIESFSLEQWKAFLWQSDTVQTEIKTREGRAIVGKANRQISNKISWGVYYRDNYTCRYCGKTGIPLTVDHIVLWEEGGPSIEENLVSSCKKCNQTRGNMKYSEWIESNLYKKISKYLPQIIKQKNIDVVSTIKDIPVSFTKMRGKSR